MLTDELEHAIELYKNYGDAEQPAELVLQNRCEILKALPAANSKHIYEPGKFNMCATCGMSKSDPLAHFGDTKGEAK
jgi:hypothetical protein